MSKKEFLALLDKYLSGRATTEEKNILYKVYTTFQETDSDEFKEFDLDILETKALDDFRKKIGRPIIQIEDQIIKTKKHVFYNGSLFRVAASLTIFIGIALIYWARQSYYRKQDFAQIIEQKKSSSFTYYYNLHSPVQKIVFPDGSYVNLSKGSKIGFDNKFPGNKREVYLIGEGYFQVTKNHLKPFIVYTDKIVAKVLGTSFIVKNGLNNSPASVLVKTGKVSVFKRREFTELDSRPDLTGGVVLTPNHIAALNDKDVLEKKISDKPELVKGSLPDFFDFNETPISVVFERLESAYGINISYDKAKMSMCTISVKMGKEDFYEKLDLVCHTINAAYVVRNGDVEITGNGCGN